MLGRIYKKPSIQNRGKDHYARRLYLGHKVHIQFQCNLELIVFLQQEKQKIVFLAFKVALFRLTVLKVLFQHLNNPACCPLITTQKLSAFFY